MKCLDFSFQVQLLHREVSSRNLKRARRSFNNVYLPLLNLSPEFHFGLCKTFQSAQKRLFFRLSDSLTKREKNSRKMQN